MHQPRLPLLLAATAAVYAAVLLLTEAVFIGDAPDYARQVAARLLGRNCEYLDFGHLLWRPLGFWTYSFSGQPLAGPSQAVWLSILRHLTLLGSIFGLGTALATVVWLWRRTARAPEAMFGASLLVFSNAFLNYSQTGTSYIAGLAGLMTAFATLAPRPAGQRLSLVRCVLGGVLLAVSVLLWFPYVLAVPAAVASIVVLEPRDPRPWRSMSVTAAAFTATAGSAILVAGRALGFASLGDYREWIAQAGHGITGIGGVARAVLGLARSFIDLGDYGQLVKRFLWNDAARPVALHQLFSVRLALMIGFYLAILLIAALAARSPAGRRALALFALAAVPVVALAVTWQGGDLERYLALTPGVVLAGAEAYRNAASVRGLRAALLAFVALMLVSNLALMAIPRVALAQAPALARLEGLPAGAAPRLLIVSDSHDGIAEFNRNHPWHPANREPMRVYPLVTPGLPSVADWRRNFEREVAAAWQSGETVWVSERLVEPRPRADSGWVEGDPASLPWARLQELFARLEYGRRAGPPGDGFLALTPQAKNWEVFREIEPAPWLDPEPSECALPLSKRRHLV